MKKDLSLVEEKVLRALRKLRDFMGGGELYIKIDPTCDRPDSIKVFSVKEYIK